MPARTVTVHPADVTFTVPDGLSLLLAAQRSGRSPIAVGCRGGGCGVCRIRIDAGTATTRRMSRSHISERDEAQGIVLACRTYPTSDLVVTVLRPVEPAPHTAPPATHTSARLAAATR